MRKTKTYHFDKDYLILNEMSAHYIYSEKPFSYYDSSEIVTDSHTISSVTIRLYKGDRESKPSFTSCLYQSYMFTDRLIDVATNGDVFVDEGLKSILVTKLEIRDMPDTYRLVFELL